MSKIYCQNTERGLVPLYPSDWEEKKHLKLGRVYSCDVVDEERSYPFLKKFMALCRIGCDNSKRVVMPFKAYRNYVTIKAGYADIYKTPKGIFVQAKSIAFANMKQKEFEEVYSRVLDVVIKDTGADREFIEDNLINFF